MQFGSVTSWWACEDLNLGPLRGGSPALPGGPVALRVTMESDSALLNDGERIPYILGRILLQKRVEDSYNSLRTEVPEPHDHDSWVTLAKSAQRTKISIVGQNDSPALSRASEQLSIGFPKPALFLDIENVLTHASQKGGNGRRHILINYPTVD